MNKFFMIYFLVGMIAGLTIIGFTIAGVSVPDKFLVSFNSFAAAGLLFRITYDYHHPKA